MNSSGHARAAALKTAGKYSPVKYDVRDQRSKVIAKLVTGGLTLSPPRQNAARNKRRTERI